MIIPENIRAVIFDLDGTLVDSMWVWRQIDIDYLGRFGYELPDDLQSSIDGMSFSETAVYIKERFNIPDSVEQMKDDWNEMCRDYYRERIGFKPGAYQFISELKNRGIKTGIATSNSTELLNTILKSLGVEDYFDSIHVSCEVEKGKPAPDIYLLVASDMNVNPDNCLVFEDITQGITAAHAAGMKACGIYDEISYSRGHRLKDCADYYIEDYTEVSFYDE